MLNPTFSKANSICKLIKKITFYQQVLKLKSFWISHIAVAGFYICEIFTLILTIFETLNEQYNLKNGIVQDYVFGFKIYFLLNHFLFFMFLGFCEIVLFILFVIIKFILKKDFIIKFKLFTNNTIYNFFWTIGFYVTFIISFCVFIYLIIIMKEGIIWLIEQWQF